MVESSPRKGRRNLLIRSRPVLRWVIRLRSSPRAIAGGLALGTFIAFTPTFGIQLVLAVVCATIINVNRPASLIPVWITNPVTIAPIYTFNYWLGCKIWDGPPLAEVSEFFVEFGQTMARLEFWNIKSQVLAAMNIGKDIFIPLLAGSVIIGFVTGLLTYIVAINLLSFFFARRAKRHILSDRKKR